MRSLAPDLPAPPVHFAEAASEQLSYYQAMLHYWSGEPPADWRMVGEHGRVLVPNKHGRAVAHGRRRDMPRVRVGDVVAPDLGARLRDMGWCCPSCGDEMIARVRDWPYHQDGVQMPRPRWRLYCAGTCGTNLGPVPIDYSSGSVRVHWLHRAWRHPIGPKVEPARQFAASWRAYRVEHPPRPEMNPWPTARRVER